MKILNIEIPPTLDFNKNTVQISGNQIQNSRFDIVPLNNKGQIIFKFKIELTPNQHSEIERVTKLPAPTLKCIATISEGSPAGTGTIKSELSYNGSEYILTGFL